MARRNARYSTGAKAGRWLAVLLALALAAMPPLVGSARAPQAVPALDPAATSAQLASAAERYRELAKDWQPMTGAEPLQAGDRDERVVQLRRLLKLYGDYTGLPGPVTVAAADPQRFDSALQRAVERYQRRHGLQPSGTVAADTLAELAVPPTERARQLELNAKRWKKLSLPKEGRYLFVNVPEYHLQLVEKGTVTLRMKTVVGKTSSRTPTLRTRVTNVVFNPTWTVPRSILLTEMLPKARNNPEAMHKRGYRVVNYGSSNTVPISADGLIRAAGGDATLRQVSGPGNTLGRVKFVMPNRQAIYLHDTQAQSLFDLQERAFSHGCIRLEQPEELAYALLRPQGWDRTRVAQATTGDETLNIKVDRPPRLFITYITAWMDNHGRPHFRRDIYHRDTEQEAAD
ncbi:Putative peptidoglycan binding domain-containing protein [Microbulbifer donghaiensis]|uniref:Putative peptidoglycan binding domain-containing protein n=1 Tax=Microbulbifer donghaiensis TaxID=494016 RepID=A0A1M5F4X0_9GAMM|nr:L,D-transpeptidase family protein [Microbulbifer donghaiensis]SHF86650.1 Putative peptidoglycan binding domain-containing protein [Microbulbifer donghaiensis]